MQQDRGVIRDCIEEDVKCLSLSREGAPSRNKCGKEIKGGSRLTHVQGENGHLTLSILVPSVFIIIIIIVICSAPIYI